MKVAILHSGDTSDMKGIMNFVHEKALYMQQNEQVKCDVFCVRSEFTRLFTWLVLRKKYEYNHKHPDTVILDGVVYNFIWIKYGLYDCFISSKVFKNLISLRYYHLFEEKLNGYDVLTTHNLDCHQIALRLRRKYPIKVYCTWHGTDIHTLPFNKSGIIGITKYIIENANMNFFVSKNLLEISDRITTIGNKQVLYTGPSSAFCKYGDAEKKRCHMMLSKDADYIIGFVGNLIAVKNVMIIPDILSKLITKLPPNKKVQLIIAGDGPLRDQLKAILKERGLYFSFLGNVSPSKMPNIMNGLDILILPSIKEGLPLVTLEAISCGLTVVGSKVGGIPEVLGEKNCFVLDDSFIDNITSRMADVLITNEKPDDLPNVFSWESAINIELSTYNKLN